MRRFVILAILALTTSGVLFGQMVPNLENGFKAFGSYDGSKVDTVNLLNRNLTLMIPVLNYPQRGALTHNYYLIYNAKKWMVSEYCDPKTDVCKSKWLTSPPTAGLGGSGVALLSDGDFSSGRAKFGSTVTVTSVIDWTGSSHTFGMSDANPLYPGYYTYRTADGSGYTYSQLCQPPSGANCTSYERAKTGTLLSSTVLPSTVEDTNGNLITNPSGAPTYDTIGRPLKPSWTSPSSDATGCRGPRTPTSYSILTIPGINSGAQIKICSVAITLKTNFQQLDELFQPITENHGVTDGFMQSFIIYDGNSWTTSPQWIFEYADNADGTNYGDLTKITFPTGATISYQWATDSLCNNAGPGNTPVGRSLVSRTTDANDGSGPQVWTYSANGKVTDPLLNDTVHVFDFIGGGGCGYQYEVKTQWYSGSQSTGTLLKTVLTQYRSTTTTLADMSNSRLIAAILPSVVTTQWPNGKQSKVETDYVDTDGVTGTTNVYDVVGTSYRVPIGNVIETREYNFQSGGTYTLARRTHYTYLPFQNSNYFNRNLLDRVSSVSVYDGSGALKSQTNYAYDASALQPSGVSATYLDGSIGSYRGNQTSSSRWVSGSSYLTTSTSYYNSGMPYQVTDPGGHTTTYTYSTTYQGAYVTQTQKPDTHSPNLAHHVVSGTYDFNTGLLTGFTDENQQSSSYGYDIFGRMQSASYPDRGSVNFTYPDFVTVTRKKAIDSSHTYPLLEQAQFDGFGRAVRRATANDGAGNSWNQKDTCYSANGWVSFTSYPYQSSSVNSARDCTGATNPGDKYSYDGMGRVTSILHSDGSSIATSYTGAAVLTVDEGNGTTQVSRVAQSDALGRLVSLCEGSAANGPGNPTLMGFGATPAACGQDIALTGYLTTYQYDPLGNLLSSSQGGYTTRTFDYDGVSRLIDSTNPESGYVSYTYWPDSMVNTRTRPLPNQTATDTSHQVTTTYTYDELHRERGVSYNKGSTPSTTFNYDETTVAGHATTYGIGHLTSESTGNTGEYFWNFDKMGRVQGRSQCVPSTSNPNACGTNYDFTYTFDYLGNELTASLPTGVTLTSAYDQAARLSSVTSSLSDPNHPASLLGNVAYGPFGILTATVGSIYGEQRSYTTRGWLWAVSDTAPSRTDSYSFSIPETGGFAPDGNILQVTDNVNGNWTYTYDSFNRLSTAVTNTGPGCSYKYDRFGNRWQQNPYSGTCLTSNLTFTMNAGADNNNRMDGSNLYDAPGNLVHDPNNGSNYAYDNENRLATVGTYSYVYDGEGRRVAKLNGNSVASEYLFDNAGAQQIEMDGSGNVAHTNVFAGGKLLATYRNDGQTYLHFSDWLGTRRLQVSFSGQVEPLRCSNFPFGDNQICVGPDATEHHFTGKERDTESGLDNFVKRYFGSSLGRFMTPDPVGIMKQKLIDPQQWNMYSYARNNPLRFTDPTGKYVCDSNKYKTQCAQIKEGYDAAQKALAAAKPKSEQAKQLKSALDFLGAPGKANGVVVTFGGLDKGTNAQTHTETTTDLLGKSHTTTEIKFDLQQLDFKVRLTSGHPLEPLGNDTGAVLVHEGTHGRDDVAQGHDPESRAEALTTERNAYRNEGYVYDLLGVPSYVNPSLTAPGANRDEVIEKLANASADASGW